ncbi:ribonuclease P protein component [Desulfolucanica intricata]|uniref:ribonuclease P protein component n=1 Tax=Desulfolucanica intricata TaxID=1285191 RepID=UPI00082E9353|nr:ribonuclease P protein component [Desulfolucanica intricata]
MGDFIILRKNSDYRRVYNSGKSVANKYFVLFALKNSLDISRFGFSVSKKVGKAVKRNKIRRTLKEICRLNNDLFPLGYDYVILARKDAVNQNFWQIKNHLNKLALKVFK